MLPPRPPSPPSGPPKGTNFSRRNDTMPLPPSPAFTHIRASSTSMLISLVAVHSTSDASIPHGPTLSTAFHRGPMQLDSSGCPQSCPAVRHTSTVNVYKEEGYLRGNVESVGR